MMGWRSALSVGAALSLLVCSRAWAQDDAVPDDTPAPPAAPTDNAQDTQDAPNDDPSEQPPKLTPPKLIQFVEATYPPEAKEAGDDATVEVDITIGVDGAVTDAQVVRGAGQGFDEAALDAVRRFLFEPARRGDEAIASRIRYRYVFELTEEIPAVTDAQKQETSPGQLAFTVLSREDNEPVPQAEVVVTAVPSPPAADGTAGDTRTAPPQGTPTPAPRRAVTDKLGKVTFEGLPPGKYGVTIFADEFGEFRSEERVESDRRIELTYRLNLLRDPNAFGASAVVEAPPREVIKRSITREQLTRIPGTRGDALRTVQLLPGVGRPPFGAGVIIVRGSAPQDSETLLDSAPVPLLYHFGGITSVVNSRLLEQIDFYPGNFSVRYGRKTGGILDASTRDPATDGLHGVLDINVLDASILAEGPVSDKLAVAVAARRSYIDFFFENIVPDDAFDVVAAPVYFDYQAIATWKPSDRDKVRMVAYGSGDRFRLVFSEPQEGDPTVRGNLDLETGFHRLFVRWDRILSKDVDQTIQVAAGPTNLLFGLGDSIRFDGDFLETEWRAEWRARLSKRFRWIGGVDMTLTPLSIRYSGPAIGQSEGNPRNSPGPGGEDPLTGQPQESIDIDEVTFNPALYTEFDFRPFDKLQTILGMRLDYYNQIRHFTFDPRLVSIYSISDTLRVKAGVGLFSQPPEPQEAADDIGNPDLGPIHSVHTGAGIEKDVDKGFKIGAESFFKYLWNRVVSGGTDGNGPLENNGFGRIYGLELSAQVNPNGRRWFGFLSYTLSRSERRDGPDQPWRLFDFDQTHILNAAAVYKLGAGWEVGATVRIVTGNPITPIVGGTFDVTRDVYRPVFGDVNSQRADYFHRLDVRVEKQFEFKHWKLAFYLDVQNIYNSTNPEGQVYNFDFSQEDDIPGIPILPSLGIRGEL